MVILLLLSFVNFAFLQQGDNVVFTQIKYEGNWDPYPEVYKEIIYYLELTSSIKLLPERRIITFKDKLLFSSPFIIILGTYEFPSLSNEEIDILRRYLKNGGFIFIEDCSGKMVSNFDKRIRQEFSKIFPHAKFSKIPPQHVVYKSFYLIKTPFGRKNIKDHLEEIIIDGRTAVLYSRNDIFGSLAKDKFGNHLWDCIPNGELQRSMSLRLLLNIFVFSACGTYKTDVIHQPYIERKLMR